MHGLKPSGRPLCAPGLVFQVPSQDDRQLPTANCQPIPGDMPVEEGLIFGGIRYHGEEFIAEKVRFMRTPKDDPGSPGLGLSGVYTWADVQRVAECHQGYCWIADRIDDYRGARGPVWRRISANDGLWLIFKRAEDKAKSHPSSFILHPSFVMIKAVIDNSQREVDVEMVIGAIALASQFGGPSRDAAQDYRVICVVCELAEQNRRVGTAEPVESILTAAEGLLADPTFERCFAESRKSKVESPKSKDGGAA